MPSNTNSPLILRTLRREDTERVPYWFMRQAGRYLPEYRTARAAAGSFLGLCYDPVRATEVTLQPIARFDCDAAIIFADILLVAHALGQELDFVEGKGPVLSPTISSKMLGAFSQADIHDRLGPIYETVSLTRKHLSNDKAVIGFAGAPWTVATYMIAGGSIKSPSSLRSIFLNDPVFFTELLDLLTERTVEYLSRQISNGADLVQLFDSWAGGLPPEILAEVSIKPLATIAGELNNKHPDVPVILFPKGVGENLAKYAALPGVDALSLDYANDSQLAREQLSDVCVLQGGLDPLLFSHGNPEILEERATHLIETMKGVPYVFNLGHGFTPETKIELVEHCVRILRNKG